MMRFLLWLFGQRPPAHDSHARWHVQFASGPLWLMLIVAAVAVAVGIWTYRSQSVPPKRKVALAILRACILLVVALLLFRPRVVIDRTMKTRSVVAIWVDNSLAMSLRDPYRNAPMRKYIKTVSWRSAAPANRRPRPTRFDVACDTLMQGRGTWLKKLAKSQRIALFTGSDHARLIGTAARLSGLKPLIASLRKQSPHGLQTNVAGVMRDISAQLQGRPISAVVMLSDGRSTTGFRLHQTIFKARRDAIRFYPVPIGQAHTPFNVAINHVQAPDNAFVKDPIPVHALIHVNGASGPTRVDVRLYQEMHGQRGKLLAQKHVVVPAKTHVVPVTMMYREKKPQRLRMMMEAKPLPAELTRRDNTVSNISTQVLKAQIRILYVEGYPRWEYRYLKNEYIREKTVKVSCLLLSADDSFAQEGTIPIRRFPDTPKELDNYDVVLIGDVNPNYFSAVQDKMLLHFVSRKGGGFGMIAGPLYAPNAYRNTPLAPLIPVIPDRQSAPLLPPAPNKPFVMKLTAAGVQSPLFEFFNSAKKNAWQMAHMPPFYWYKPVLGLRPSAEVLATHPTATVNGMRMPLIVTGHYGEGRTFYSGIDDTWRWRFYRGEPLYQSYWLQVARLLYRQRALGRGRRIYLTADQTHVTLGQPVHFTLHVDDRGLRPQMRRKVTLIVGSGANRRRVALAAGGLSKKRYQGVMLASQVGRFTVMPRAGTLPIKVHPLHISVRLPNQEFANPTADMPALRRMAAKTGGRVVPPFAAATLGQLVPNRGIESILTSSDNLWDKPIMLFLLIGLLAAEWIVRKTASLI